MAARVYLYDTTLRDGAQTQGVDFGVADKIAIAHELDRLGIDYVEGGWPGANPTDDAFFANPPALARARLAAFGMTRRAGRSAANDPALNAVLNGQAPVVCLVAKAWDFQVETALGVSLDENLAMITDSVAHAGTRADEVMVDAEHFFDGYKADPDYARRCVETALAAGARWVVLCDTNGGTLPHEIAAIVTALTEDGAITGDRLGIHCHNDSDTAVAGSLAAVAAGVRQVQGTLNGLGERCGNANLVSVIADLTLKMGYDTSLGAGGLKRLTHVSRMLDERLNRPSNRHAPFVGESAFAHKGGLHASAVGRDPRTYEHIPPDQVGNRRLVVVSDQSGQANILARFADLGLTIDPAHAPTKSKVRRLVETVKAREAAGYTYDDAAASFELLARRSLGTVPSYFDLTSFRVMDERRIDARGQTVTLSEATMKVVVGRAQIMTVAEGRGPVDALARALNKALAEAYPDLAAMRLVDYKVRILSPEAGTAAVVRVMIESTDDRGRRWSTVGVSDNLIAASYDALHDAVTFRLFKSGAAAAEARGNG